MKKISIIVVSCIVTIGIIFFSVIWFLKDGKDDVFPGISLRELEISRQELCLRVGMQYPLKIEPDGMYHIMKEDEFQTAMNEKVSWNSSNEEVAVVDAIGNVKAQSQGRTLVTAEIGDLSFDCEVQVISESENQGISIKYKNDLFTEEIQKQISKIELKSFQDDMEEFTDQYGISLIYSVLAEMEEIESKPTEERYGFYGNIIIHMKNGEKRNICLLGAREFIYQNTSYRFDYGETGSFGKGCNPGEEIYNIIQTKEEGKLEAYTTLQVFE